MPLIVMAPLIGFVAIVSGVRTRRSAVNLAQFAFLAALASTLLVAWARWKAAGAYTSAFQWINLPVAFTGAPQFQGFGVDVILRVDHWTLAALTGLWIVLLACLAWHRAGGRAEPGPIRVPALFLLLGLAGAGVIVSNDFVELVAFWGLAGVTSYLLMATRWAVEGSARSLRVAFWLPFAADLGLLCACAILYSRYGQLDLDRLPAAIKAGALGAGLKSLTIASVLILFATFGRAGVFPFTAWMSAGAREAPPAVVAAVNGLWPLLAAALLVRTLPILEQAGPQAFRLGAWAGLVACVAGPLLSLLGNDLRRSLVFAFSGATALGLLSVWQPGALQVGESGSLAAALGRAGAILAAAALVSAMRSGDLQDMGEAARRMRITAVALALGLMVVALAFGPVPAAFRGASGSQRGLIFDIGLALTAFALMRNFAVAGLGPLRRRRAFEPARVREAAPALTSTAFGLGSVGLLVLAFTFVGRWLAFLTVPGAPGGRSSFDAPTAIAWLLVPLGGGTAGLLLYFLRRDLALGWSARLGTRAGGWWLLALTAWDRFLWQPLLKAVSSTETSGLNRAEGWLGPNLARSGGALARVPALPAIVAAALAAAILALVVGLASAGIR